MDKYAKEDSHLNASQSKKVSVLSWSQLKSQRTVERLPPANIYHSKSQSHWMAAEEIWGSKVIQLTAPAVNTRAQCIGATSSHCPELRGRLFPSPLSTSITVTFYSAAISGLVCEVCNLPHCCSCIALCTMTRQKK